MCLDNSIPNMEIPVIVNIPVNIPVCAEVSEGKRNNKTPNN